MQQKHGWGLNYHKVVEHFWDFLTNACHYSYHIQMPLFTHNSLLCKNASNPTTPINNYDKDQLVVNSKDPILELETWLVQIRFEKVLD